MVPPPKDTRDRILRAASAAIIAKSYNGCGLSEILVAASVPKGSFYYYFKSKEELGVAVIEQAAEEQTHLLRACFEEKGRSPLQRLERYYSAAREDCHAAGATCPCPIAKLALETAQLSEPMRIAIKRGYDEWTVLHAELIREAQASGEVDLDADPERLADALINAWEGAAIRMQIEREVTPLDEFVTVTLRRLLGAQ